MGDLHWRFVDTYDREHRPEEISGLILHRLSRDAAALGEPATEAVITVPAYFDDVRRKATRDAGEIAGLKVHRLVNEPTAAAIAYGMDKLASGVIFVYDLGGGTFDVTVLRASKNEFDVAATDGDRNLGGYDFDNLLMLHVAEQVRLQGGPDLLGDSRTEFNLRDQCEAAKRQLSTNDQATIYLSVGGATFEIEVTRAQFDAMTTDLLYRTEVLASGVLDDAGLTWPDVDHLLLVGGSTRMPMVRQMITRISGKSPALGVNPDEAVALGAAIVAASAAPADGGRSGPTVSLNDVTSKSMGIVATDRIDRRTQFNSIIVPRNTHIPAEEDREYYTVDDNQRILNVRVTEGEEKELAFTRILKEQPLKLTPGLPQESPLRVIMSYSLDQMIHLEVIDLTNNISLGQFELRHANQMSQDEKDRLQGQIATQAHR